MQVLGFLHTAGSHTASFDDLVAQLAPGTSTVVVVDESALARARELGPDHPEVRSRIVSALDTLAESGAEMVVCTCSTIGGAAERIGAERDQAVMRVDRPMAEQAVAVGRRIGVVAAVESTLGPTRELLSEVAHDRNVTIDVVEYLCPDAWERYEAGDRNGYLTGVADAASTVSQDCDVVVLAQASMADAADRLVLDVPVLTSSELGVAVAVQRVSGTRPTEPMLGRPVSETEYGRLDTFPVEAPTRVEFVTDELQALCPAVDGIQPDIYRAVIIYTAASAAIESKSLRLWLVTFRDRRIFAEHLAKELHDHIVDLGDKVSDVRVTLEQNVRGGIVTTVRYPVPAGE